MSEEKLTIGRLMYICRHLEDSTCEIMVPEAPGVTVRAPNEGEFMAFCAVITGLMTGGRWAPLRVEWERGRELPGAGER